MLFAAHAAAGGGEDPFSEPSEAAPALPELAAPPGPARTPRASDGYQHWLGGLYLGRGLR
ncbi:MAG TPA: hypothetical protein VNG33_01215 [Polyangiaceae bacterium]|nr:hypothetical protein [Polyangiaceae bacterium]